MADSPRRSMDSTRSTGRRSSRDAIVTKTPSRRSSLTHHDAHPDAASSRPALDRIDSVPIDTILAEGTGERTVQRGWCPGHGPGHATGRDTAIPRGASVTVTNTYLKPVTHDTIYRHEVEEIERQTTHDRHVHHVQHVLQDVSVDPTTKELATRHYQLVSPQRHVTINKEIHHSPINHRLAYATANADLQFAHSMQPSQLLTELHTPHVYSTSSPAQPAAATGETISHGTAL